MLNVDLWGILKVVVLLLVIVAALAAAVSLLSGTLDGISNAFKTAMTSEARWVTQEETTGGEWVAMVFSAFPFLRPLLVTMSTVLTLIGLWLTYLWVRRALGSS